MRSRTSLESKPELGGTIKLGAYDVKLIAQANCDGCAVREKYSELSSSEKGALLDGPLGYCPQTKRVMCQIGGEEE